MGPLAVVAGTSLGRAAAVTRGEVVTVRGVALVDAGDHVVLYRHGLGDHVPAHRIDHVANVLALREAGVDRVLALGSTGSLRRDWPIGTVVLPDDFYAPWVNPSLHATELGHTVPGFDLQWREVVRRTWSATTSTPLVDGGVYAQTRGPRFETPAEVRALVPVADVVGMTLAAECILAKEAGVAYAAVCTVDNLANGLEPEPLTIEEFTAGVAANHARLLTDLDRVVPALVAAEVDAP